MGQVALALVLLVASGLVLRTAQALRNVAPGFSHANDVLALRLSIASRMVPKAEEAALVQEAIARRLGEIPGVTSVGMATSLPMHAGGNINPLFVEGITIPGATPPITRRHKWIGEGYFETLGIPLLAGRAFTWQDVHNRIPAAVVSESLARAYWGSVAAAIGKRVSVRPNPVRWHEVVGVAADVREDGVSQEPIPMVYWPQVTLAFWQDSAADEVLLWRSASYAIRSHRVGTPDFLQEVRNAIWSVNPNLPLLAVGPLSSFVARSVARTSFTLVLLGIAAGVALILAIVGVYGVISCAVSRRTLEFGMRMALGAQAGQVRRMVLRQGLVLAGTGIIIGVSLALLVTDAMSSVLFGVSPTDPLTFVAVAAGLSAVAVAASYVPAYRASRVDPIVVLKAE
jgi:predicted permease